jgi:hypothetical protein
MGNMVPSDDEEERRRRRREREDEEEREAERKREAELHGISKPSEEGVDNRFRDLVNRAEMMIDQVNTLYNIFASGAERLPPIEKRKQLDQVIVSLKAINKPTLGALFRFNSVINRYNANYERWDKLMKSLETGRMKRPGPGR